METDLVMVSGPATPKLPDAPRHVAKRRIRAWMIQTGRTYASLAAELSVSTGHLQTVVYGLKGCSLALATRWSRLSKLPLSTFVDLRKSI